MSRLPGRPVWWIAGAAALVVAIVGFLLFRPDKLFVDDVVDEALDPEVAAALNSDPAGSPPTSEAETPSPDTSVAPTTAPETTTTVPTPTVVGEGSFVSQGGHTVRGTAVVVDGPEGRLLVLPELDSENGPDLQLYLSPRGDGSVDGGVKIAPLKGNIGTQTYELADSIDLGALPHVVIWCERFSTPFGTATLA